MFFSKQMSPPANSKCDRSTANKRPNLSAHFTIEMRLIRCHRHGWSRAPSAQSTLRLCVGEHRRRRPRAFQKTSSTRLNASSKYSFLCPPRWSKLLIVVGKRRAAMRNDHQRLELILLEDPKDPPCSLLCTRRALPLTSNRRNNVREAFHRRPRRLQIGTSNR